MTLAASVAPSLHAARQCRGHGQDARAALESIHSRKTGAMIRVSLRLGAMAVGAADDQLAALDEYGRRLGLAFQITDDLLDVRSNEAAVGKRVGKDAAAGKTHLSRPARRGSQRRRAHGSWWTKPAGRCCRWARRPPAWKRWPATSWKGIADGQAAFDDQLPARSPRPVAEGVGATGRGDARGDLPPGGDADRPFRLEPRRGRIDPGPAHLVRFQPRPPRLGHRPPSLPPQAHHRPLRRVSHDAGQGRVDGLSQPRGKRLRPVHDRPRRVQRRHGLGHEVRRRPGRAPSRSGASSRSSATAPFPPASCWRR